MVVFVKKHGRDNVYEHSAGNLNFGVVLCSLGCQVSNTKLYDSQN